MKFLLSVFFCSSFLLLHAQTSVVGKIQDSLKAPVSFCPLALMNTGDSAVVKGSMSGADGRFSFTAVRPGNYFIKINYPGYRQFSSDSFSFDSLTDKTLETITLKNNGVNLDEVDIVNIKAPIEFKGGNITVNIDGSPLAIGNSVYDLLQRLPGVSVDNDVISIQGKPGAIVYIDDRPQLITGAQLMNFLRSMNAASVEKIEVINNPPAKYDAAGSAGIINIKTKKVKIYGFSGSANGTYSQGFFENTNGGFSLNYKGRKLTVFSNVNGNQGVRHYVTRFDKTVTYDNQTTHLNQHLIDDYDNRSFISEIGADWYVNSKTIIGTRLKSIYGYGNNRDHGITAISDNSLGYRQLVLQKSLPNDWLMMNYNVNAEHSFDTLGTKLKFSADYYNPNYDNYKGTYQNMFLDSLNNDALPQKDFLSNNRLNIGLFFARLDFEKKITKTLSVEAGVKASFQDIVSDYSLKRKASASEEYITDTAFTNTFNYREKIGAAYVNLSKEIRKFLFQLGLRAEQTDIHTSTTDESVQYKRNYLNVFPTISIDYNRSKDHIFSMGYNKRIGRPDYNSLNPYRSFVDVLNYYQGNPYLKQAYAHNFNLNYAYKGSVFNALTYSLYQSAISGYTSQNDTTKESTQHVTNLDYFQVLRYSFYIRKELRRWWTVSFNFGTYYVGYSGMLNGQKYSLSAVPHYEWISNMFALPKEIKIELTAYYWSPWLGIASKYKARGAMSLAVKKSFLKNTMTCSIAVNDIFFSETLTSTADFQNQKWQRFESSDTRRLNISLSYNFGKIKIEKRTIEEEGGKITK